MMSIARCSTRRLAVLAIATGGSEPRIVTVCPPVVEYSREFQARAVEELDVLPEGAAIAEMLSDYAVIREQARACRSSSH